MGSNVFGHAAALAALIASSLGCGSGDDRPPCNVGNCFEEDGGGGDGDADTDADADGDADAPDCTDPDGDGHLDWRCEGGDDCAERDPNVHPGATEVCNGIDDNCRNGVDEELLVSGDDIVIPASVTGTTRHIAFARSSDGYGLLRLEQLVDAKGIATYNLELLKVAAAGTAGAPVLVSESANFYHQDSIALAADGEDFVAAFADAAGRPEDKIGGTITVALIRDTDVTPVEVGTETYDQTPSVAVGEDTALVVWDHDHAVVHFAILSLPRLEVEVDEDLFAGDAYFTVRPSVVWTGDRYLVAAVDDRHRVRVIAIDEAGARLSDNTLGSGATPSIAWDGTQGLVVHGDDDIVSNAMLVAAIDADGARLGDDEPLVLENGEIKLPHVAGAGGVFALVAPGVTGDITSYAGEIQFSLLSPSGIASNAIAPDDSVDADAALEPWVVPDGNGGWALAWIETDYVATRLDFVTCEE